MTGSDDTGRDTRSDDRLSAWIDGALSEAEARELEDMAMQDEALAARAADLRRIDDLVRTAIPEEPVPAELLERLGLARPAQSNVVDLLAERSRRQAAPGPAAAARPAARFWDTRKVAAILVLVSVGLASAVLMPSRQAAEPDAAYRMLGDAQQAGMEANMVVMFGADVDAGEARAIAASVGAKAVGEPSSAGAWKLAIDPARRDAALSSLRRRADVTMAEPVESGQP